MDRDSQTRAPVRGSHLAVALGGLVGLAIGCAYVGGSVAKASSVRLQAERIISVRQAGYSDEALIAATGGYDASALAIARRHDPFTVAGGAQRDRQAVMLTARLEELRSSGSASAHIRQISYSPADRTPGQVPGVSPFRLGGSIDASRDLECLTQAVYYEARGEGRAGMQAVAQVVLNRARHSAFPNTVCGVVFQGAGRRTGCQFSFTCDGSMRRPINRAAWSRARDVASSALSGQVYAPVGTATHFHTTAVSPVWRHSLVQVNRVGSHVFYRFGGRSGGSSAFAYEPAPSTALDGAPATVQAGLDAPVRQMGEAVAYTLVLAQEGLAPPDAERSSERQSERQSERTQERQPAAPAQPVARAVEVPVSES